MYKALFLTGMVLLSSALHASRGKARTMVERMGKEAKTGKVTPRAQIEQQQKLFEAEVFSTLRNRPGMTSSVLKRTVMREYIYQNKATKENLEALDILFESITAKGNVVIAEQMSTANLLAETIVLGSKGRFSLEARDVLEIHRNWTVKEKDQLADVLTETRKLQEENPSLSADVAFEQALANRGLLEQFRKRCK